MPTSPHAQRVPDAVHSPPASGTQRACQSLISIMYATGNALTIPSIWYNLPVGAGWFILDLRPGFKYSWLAGEMRAAKELCIAPGTTYSSVAPPTNYMPGATLGLALLSPSECTSARKGRRARGTTPTLHHYLVPILASSRPYPRALTTTRAHALRRYTSSLGVASPVLGTCGLSASLSFVSTFALEPTDTCTKSSSPGDAED
ncbi:hypothetical protein K438DRAFT_2031000 [Mycena galopus ATCC 62051]|nr:hypothetical protein K438DRAFT_2031000 [Mycena galopus ATCC 62051]